MPIVAVSDEVEISYEILDPSESAPVADGTPILLIQGLGGQLISWDDDFCEELTCRGYRVVRFDNRDVGESTKIEGAGFPEIGRALSGDGSAAAYSIADMASDAAGLLAALGIDQAHVVGVSMGGMIAQTLAISCPDKVSSLVSIMSTTGHRGVGAPSPEAIQVLLTPPPTDRRGAIEASVKTWPVLWGSGYPFEEERVAEKAGRLFDRCHNPQGIARQLVAILSQPDRTSALGHLSMPTLVIHGNEDPLVSLSGGEATAAAIPGARLMVLDKVGHVLPQPVWDQVCDAIVANARQTLSRSVPRTVSEGTSQAGRMKS